MKKRLFALLTVLVLVLTGCGRSSFYQYGQYAPQATFPEQPQLQQPTLPQYSDPQQEQLADSWSIYWYLCGSDLESRNGFATADLSEMLQVQVPENVNIIIQTGGAKKWQNSDISANKMQRWIYNSRGLSLLEESAQQNMGDGETLRDFLDYASSNFPAKREAVLFWNHGGGSVSGAAFDERYDYDSLTLGEMDDALSQVFQGRELEMVCFDTCLMATVDVAATFSPYARYLVASQEVEPGLGWDYDTWLAALAQKPGMDGKELGVTICNSYYNACAAYNLEDQITLSVTDLTKVPALLDAYEKFGQEALVEAATDSTFFTKFGKAANGSENYGGNTPSQGYSNMVDLGHLARQTDWLLPSAQAVNDALEACVVYQVRGVYRPEATGLSCYYSYNGNTREFNDYVRYGTGSAFKHLYAYGLSGELQDSSVQYLQQLDIYQMAENLTLLDTDWADKKLYVDSEGCAVLELGPKAEDILTTVYIQLFYVDVETDLFMHLGFDNDLIADWGRGVFKDNFRGVWGAIDGHLVYMELSYEGDDYNLYAVPIMLNGEEYNLQVVYDFTEAQWYILGATKGLEEWGMAGKELQKLQPGDTITTLWMASTISYDDELTLYEAETFKVKSDTAFGEAEVLEGVYAMAFEMQDSAGNIVRSDLAYFEVTGDMIYTSIDFPQ